MCYQKQNLLGQAQKLYSKIKPHGDIALLTSVTNNQLAIKSEGTKLFDFLKINQKKNLDTKFTQKQSLILNLNKICLLLKKKRFQEAQDLYNRSVKQANIPASVQDFAILVEANLAIFAEKDVKKAEKILLKGEKSILLLTALGELYQNHIKDSKKAMDTYSAWPESARAEPEILDTLCNYALKNKKLEEVETMLESAIEQHGSDIEKLGKVLAVGMKYLPYLKDNAFSLKILQLYVEEVSVFFRRERAVLTSLAAIGPEAMYQLCKSFILRLCSVNYFLSLRDGAEKRSYDGKMPF